MMLNSTSKKQQTSTSDNSIKKEFSAMGKKFSKLGQLSTNIKSRNSFGIIPTVQSG
jgi:hypothetical protein